MGVPRFYASRTGWDSISGMKSAAAARSGMQCLRVQAVPEASAGGGARSQAAEKGFPAA
jgi:hypothetical protein